MGEQVVKKKVFRRQTKKWTTVCLDESCESCTDECPKYLFQYPNPENDIVWGSQECDVPPAYQVKQSAKVMVWGGMTDRGLTRLHILPSKKIVKKLRFVQIAKFYRRSCCSHVFSSDKKTIKQNYVIGTLSLTCRNSWGIRE